MTELTQPNEDQTPLMRKWLAQGKYTCTIAEFASLYGVREDYARELCKSIYSPPGFYSGNRYKILVSELEDHMKGIARKHPRFAAH